ncbi:MAG: hypothetical protein ACTH2P_08640 [Oceanisphaera sp.]
MLSLLFRVFRGKSVLRRAAARHQPAEAASTNNGKAVNNGKADWLRETCEG